MGLGDMRVLNKPPAFWAKVFGVGFFMGATIEYTLVKYKFYEHMTDRKAKEYAGDMDTRIDFLEDFKKNLMQKNDLKMKKDA
ncbi:hypothetical protein PROFUN_10608 [Planoprotostelium fungivorum]|uniref:Uncharacterized protein n=1 Tax=Planoprotostelium fungivorum TaxID=1890364 RepID=A0A2P6ND75_9EUKA|nr:hypothetical protein PROFUN_10608 [Planoprotostelium fungivorum]